MLVDDSDEIFESVVYILSERFEVHFDLGLSGEQRFEGCFDIELWSEGRQQGVSWMEFSQHENTTQKHILNFGNYYLIRCGL